jgi:hypothetical protein
MVPRFLASLGEPDALMSGGGFQQLHQEADTGSTRRHAAHFGQSSVIRDAAGMPVKPEC